MRQRSPGSCFNTLVFNSAPIHDRSDSGLSRAEELLCFRGVEAYLRACKKDKQPRRSILLTGANCGELDENRKIVRDNGTMAAFVLKNFGSISESDILIGVETSDVEENLKECRGKHDEFAERVSRKGNQTLGVVSYEELVEEEDEDIADISLRVFRSKQRQIIRLPVYHPFSTLQQAAQEPSVLHDPGEEQAERAMAADS